MATTRNAQPDRVRSKWNWGYWPSSPVPQHLPEAEALFEHSPHPELEDHTTIAWGFAECERERDHSATLNVLTCCGRNVEWRYDVDADQLERILASTSESETVNPTRPPNRRLSIFFLDTLQSRLGWLPGNCSFPPRILYSLRRAGLSNTILNAIFSVEGGWSKMGNQCFLRKDDKGCLSSFEVCYRYQCGWSKGSSFTHLCRSRYHTTYFCINYPPYMLRKLNEYIKKNIQFAYRDFFLDALAAGEGLRQWQIEIGIRARQLYFHEDQCDDNGIDFHDGTRQLHTLAWEWNTLGQDCRDQAVWLDFLHRTYAKYMMLLQDEKNAWVVDRSSDMGETFEALKSHCDNCARWTSVYKERTNIRINFLFHLANQRESHTNTQIAISSARIAEQTRRDSASMITMAAVTMFFLPGTFVSTILSTTIFDFGDEKLKVSKTWWTLPASIIPMTIGVFGVWLTWTWWRIRTQQVKEGASRRVRIEAEAMEQGPKATANVVKPVHTPGI